MIALGILGPKAADAFESIYQSVKGRNPFECALEDSFCFEAAAALARIAGHNICQKAYQETRVDPENASVMVWNIAISEIGSDMVPELCEIVARPGEHPKTTRLFISTLSMMELLGHIKPHEQLAIETLGNVHQNHADETVRQKAKNLLNMLDKTLLAQTAKTGSKVARTEAAKRLDDPGLLREIINSDPEKQVRDAAQHRLDQLVK